MAEQPRPSGRPAPKEVFMLWLMLLPEKANKVTAARQEIARIDASSVFNQETRELRELFTEIVDAS